MRKRISRTYIEEPSFTTLPRLMADSRLVVKTVADRRGCLRLLEPRALPSRSRSRARSGCWSCSGSLPTRSAFCRSRRHRSASSCTRRRTKSPSWKVVSSRSHLCVATIYLRGCSGGATSSQEGVLASGFFGAPYRTNRTPTVSSPLLCFVCTLHIVRCTASTLIEQGDSRESLSRSFLYLP